MSDNQYARESLKPRKIYEESAKLWWPAIKLAFFPFLIAVVCDILLAFASHHVHTPAVLYALKILSVLIIYYCVMLIFYRVHCYWQGDQSSFKQKLAVYSRRFLPALVVFVVILAGAGVLMLAGEVMAKILIPYAHLMGQVAAPILISVVGLLAVIWVIACFYWPFFMIRDGERFVYAMRRSFSATALTKSVMMYLPPAAFVLVFLFSNTKLPWVNFSHLVWVTVGMSFLIKWILGAWVLGVTCLMMNESSFMLKKIESDIAEKKRKKAEKKAGKKNNKES